MLAVWSYLLGTTWVTCMFPSTIQSSGFELYITLDYITNGNFFLQGEFAYSFVVSWRIEAHFLFLQMLKGWGQNNLLLPESAIP